MVAKTFLVCGLLLSISRIVAGTEYDEFLKPLFAADCIKCHGGEKVKGKVNLKEIADLNQFLTKPKLIQKLIEVIDGGDMPPDDEPALKADDRAKLLATLR
ncbi:MAG: hypothetical protein WCN98_21020, partial [Verrucomicrobiaceae bacterium]